MGIAMTMPTSAAPGGGARCARCWGSVSLIRAVRAWSSPGPRARRRAGGGSEELPHDHLQGVAEPAVDAQGGGRLEARVHHAVLAPGVVPWTIIVPGRVVQEVREALVVGVGDQVAGALPALD